MARAKLALALVLKDEAETIEEVIKSIWYEDKPLYSELVIGIDDSTDDNTEEICRKYTDKIYYFTWENSFSKPRNFISEKCEALDVDVILMPDGHEVLSPEGLPFLNNFLEQNSEPHKILQPYILMMEDEGNIPKHIFPRPIMWRTGEGIRWMKDVHNFIDFTDDEKRKAYKKNSRFVTPELKFKHKMPKKRKEWRNKQRTDMNVPGLYKQLEEKGNSDNPRDLFYLGNTYADAGDFEKGIKYLKKAVDAKADGDLLAQACITVASLLYTKMDSPVEARQYLLQAMVARYDRAEPYFYMAYIAFKEGKLKEAIHWAEISYRMTVENDMPVTAYFLDGRIYSWYPSDILMTCYSEQNEPDKALYHAGVVRGFLGKDDDRMNQNIHLIENSALRMDATRMLESIKMETSKIQEKETS